MDYLSGVYVVGGVGFVDSNKEAQVEGGTLSLRPIVSIDLKVNGYTMTSEVDEDGKITIKLE